MKKLLIGGSPCTHWSIAQKNNRETKAEGIGWELFKNYLIAKEKFKPDFFLYENNKSAAQPIKDQIAQELGVGKDPKVRFTYINSALVSAQNRQRFYVTNFGDIEQPEDRGILLRDVLEGGASDREKAYCLHSGYCKLEYQNWHKRKFSENKNKQQHDYVAEPVNITVDGKSQCLRATCYKDGIRNLVANDVDRKTCVAEPVEHGNPRYLLKNFKTDDEKANTPTASSYKGIGSDGMITVADPVCMRYERSEEAKRLRKQYEAGEIQHGFNEHRELHPRTDDKSNTLSTVLKDNLICEPVGFSMTGTFGNRNASVSEKAYCLAANPSSDMSARVIEPIRVGDFPNEKGEISGSQATRIYDIDGKSVCLQAGAGGQGAKTGLYAVPVEFDNDTPTKAISCADGKTYPVYQVLNGQITIKDKQYPIKLQDGYYIIRKLTVTECCRLQTMPDDYCRAVSASQGYKGLGNGWTAEVIIHLLKHTNIPLDEEIVVLSMYDGIGTGRYCLDKMGYKNVRYIAYEIDKYAMQIANSNYPDIIQCGDAFQVRRDDWRTDA